MVFGFLADTIEKTLDAAADSIDALADGELPDTKDLATMLDTGLSIAAIASMYGASEEVIKGLVE